MSRRLQPSSRSLAPGQGGQTRQTGRFHQNQYGGCTVCAGDLAGACPCGDFGLLSTRPAPPSASCSAPAAPFGECAMRPEPGRNWAQGLIFQSLLGTHVPTLLGRLKGQLSRDRCFSPHCADPLAQVLTAILGSENRLRWSHGDWPGRDDTTGVHRVVALEDGTIRELKTNTLKRLGL